MLRVRETLNTSSPLWTPKGPQPSFKSSQQLNARNTPGHDENYEDAPSRRINTYEQYRNRSVVQKDGKVGDSLSWRSS